MDEPKSAATPATLKEEQLYRSLLEEAVTNETLSEENRLKFYALHAKVKTPNNDVLHGTLLREIRRQKEFNPRMRLSEQERKMIFKLLEEKRKTVGLNRHEYRYYCFIAWRHDLPIHVGTPCVPEIVDVDLKEFEGQFGVNAHRKKLIDVLDAASKKCVELYEVNELTLLVGGSFVNVEKEMPGDIDVILLLDIKTYSSDIRGNKSNSIMKAYKDSDNTNLFDLVKLITPLDDDHYMVYELLTLLGNASRDRSESTLMDNHFECRKLYRLTIVA